MFNHTVGTRVRESPQYRFANEQEVTNGDKTVFLNLFSQDAAKAVKMAE